MRTRRTISKAFTLVEILIVVVILGILAAIVVPQFTNATQDAQGGNIQSQLKTLQNQIELYAARNNGAYPPAATFWDTLIQGGYIKAAPKNPAYTGAGDPSSITVADATGSAAAAWVFTTSGAAAPLLPNNLYASNFNESTGRVSSNPAD